MAMTGNVSYVTAQTTTRITVQRYQHGAKKSQQKVIHKKRWLKVLSTSTVANIIDVMVFGLEGKSLHSSEEHTYPINDNRSSPATPAAVAPEPETGLMGTITELPIEVDFG